MVKQRDRVVTYPTAKATDLVFFEIHDSTLPKNQTPEYGTAHPDPINWPDHKLVYISPQDDAGNQKWYYAADRESQDDYNYEFTDADIGGTRFKAVARTYMTPRSEFTAALHTMGEAMPNIPTGMFGTGYVLAIRRQGATEEAELNSLYVFERLVYVKRNSMADIGTDPLNGLPLTALTTLHYATELVTGIVPDTTYAEMFADPTNSWWGLQSDGTERTGEQLSGEWYAVTVSTKVAGTFVNGVVTVLSYTSNENYYWPPVLDNIIFKNWERRDGGIDIFPYITYAKEGYNGPCLTTTTLKWSKAAFVIPKVDQMLPTSIHYASPFFVINVPECLHGAITLACDIGNTDPEYTLNALSGETTAATNYVDWDTASPLTAYDDQTPFRGGFLRTTRVVTKPS